MSLKLRFFSSFLEKCPLKKIPGKKTHELPQVIDGHVMPGASMWPPQPLLIDLGRRKADAGDAGNKSTMD